MAGTKTNEGPISKEELFEKYLTEDWVIKTDGKYTFFGVLHDYYEDVARRWTAKVTRTDYMRDYERFILPDLEDKPLEKCLREDFDAVIQKLPERKAALGQVCSEQTKRHIWVIMEYVLEAAEANGICKNVLWGSEYDLSETAPEEELLEKEFVKLRKSLTIREEYRVFERIMRDIHQPGENFGLALMFCLGLRNSEACGADFQDIRPMDCDSSCLWVYKTTEGSSNVQRFGGKTGNVSRIIPLPSVLKELLEARRELLIEKILSGELVLPGVGKAKPGRKNAREQRALAEKQVNMLPIACDGYHYAKHCSAPILTREGTLLLRKAQLKRDMVAFLNQDIRHPGRSEEGIIEKDPTAYLFRRNLGTHLYLLGLTDSEIQYIIGHEIEDDNDERNFFRNEEKLCLIARKMAMRPIVNRVEELREALVDGNSFSAEVLCTHQLKVPIRPQKKRGRLRIRITQREPGDSLSIRVSHEGIPFHKTRYIQYENRADYSPTLVITRQYHRKYTDVYNAMSEAQVDEKT